MRLRHQPRLHAHERVAHLAVQFRLGHQRGHRVHHEDVDGTRGDQRAGDLERLLGVVRLRHQQVVHVHAQLARVVRIQRVLDVDERRHAAGLLRLRDDLQRHGGLARRLRAEDLADSAARQTAHPSAASSEIEPVEMDDTGTTGFLGAEPQHRALAELFLDLAQRDPEYRERSFSSMSLCTAGAGWKSDYTGVSGGFANIFGRSSPCAYAPPGRLVLTLTSMVW